MRSLLGNRRYLIALIIVIAFGAADFFLGLFVVGGSDTVYNLNTLFPILWGLLAIILLARLVNHERENKVASRVFGLLLWGLVLWVLGDTLYGAWTFHTHPGRTSPGWSDILS
jgi:sorbitol-specific phosphotransferase system component IIC